MDRMGTDLNDLEGGTKTIVAADGGGNSETCADLGIRIDREGVWYHGGAPIHRRSLIALLGSALHRADNGDYVIVLPTERGRIEVEDAPFLGVEIFATREGAGRIVSLRTNMDEIVPIDDDHPLRVVSDPETGEPAPYVEVRAGLEAKLTRAAFYDVVGLGQEEDTECGRIYGLWSSGRFFPMGRLEDEPESA